MDIWNRVMEILGRIIWRLGRVPAKLESESDKQEWFRRYGVSATLIGLLFMGWEAVLARSAQLKYALNQLVLDQPPLFRITGAFLIVAILVSRILLATFALGMLLAIVGIFVRRPRDRS